MKVPFIDFTKQFEAIKEDLDSGLAAIFAKGDFILGQKEKIFEGNFAKYCQAKYAVGVNSGTDALHLALKSLGIGEGDEVILPTFTFIATSLAVSYTGAKPIFADSDDLSCNIDTTQIEKLINDKTKAIIAVHLYGQPADMDEINMIAKGHNIAVVEDAAQAHGAEYKGKRVGSLGDVACFSFYPTKGLGACGDGGIIVTNKEGIYKKAQMLRDYGRVDRYDHQIIGFNSRLDTIQALILDEKLKSLDKWNQMRLENAEYYCQLLDKIDGVEAIGLKADRTYVYQTFAIRTRGRNKVHDQMREKDVSVLIHYPICLHEQTAYKDLGYKRQEFPVAEKIADEVLSLPMYPHMKKEEIKYVCKSLKESI